MIHWQNWIFGVKKKKTIKNKYWDNHYSQTDNNIGGYGVKMICEGLKTNSSVEELILSSEDDQNKKERTNNTFFLPNMSRQHY